MPEIAFIREKDCIGCGKCLPVCPVDAIVGAPKWLHTVIVKDCISCKRCLPACPVDCIDWITMDQVNDNSLERSEYIRTLAERRKIRLARETAMNQQQFQNLKPPRNSYE